MDRNQALAVAHDVEGEQGVFNVGKRYYVRTPTFHYTGRLTLVTPSVFVFEEQATVYECGPYEEFFPSGGKPSPRANVRHMVGAGRMIIDRGGTVLVEIGEEAPSKPNTKPKQLP